MDDQTHDTGADVRSAETPERPRTVLLLTPSTDVAGHEACRARIDDDGEENVLVVSYTQTLDDVIESVWSQLGRLPGELGLISFDDMTRSAASAETRSLSGNGITLTTMSDPENLQGLGTAMRLYLDEWATRETDSVVCFTSFTHLLWYTDLEDAVEFVAALSTLFSQTGTVGHFHLDPSKVDDLMLSRLREEFDEVVEADPRSDHREPELTADVIHRLLSNSRRRYVLAFLSHVQAPVTLRTLSEQVAAWEQNVSEAELAPGEAERMRTSLATSHLPQLRDAGVVESGEDGNVLELTETARESETFRALVDLASSEYGFE